jgi:hypothetical protein
MAPKVERKTTKMKNLDWQVDRIDELRAWYRQHATTPERRAILNSIFVGAAVVEARKSLGSQAALQWISKEVNSVMVTIRKMDNARKN